MPVRYSFDGRVFRLDCVGTYTVDALKKAYESALEDPAFPTEAVLLMDVRRSEALGTQTSEEIRSIAQVLAPRAHRYGRRCAIIAPTGLLYGLMRMAGAYGERFGIETMVFQPEAEAEASAWLDVQSKPRV